jgi:hypothetical protein
MRDRNTIVLLSCIQPITNPFAVGGKPREHLEALVVRELARGPSREGHGVEIPGIGEHDAVGRRRGEAKKPRFGLGRRPGGREKGAEDRQKKGLHGRLR